MMGQQKGSLLQWNPFNTKMCGATWISLCYQVLQKHKISARGTNVTLCYQSFYLTEFVLKGSHCKPVWNRQDNQLTLKNLKQVGKKRRKKKKKLVQLVKNLHYGLKSLCLIGGGDQTKTNLVLWINKLTWIWFHPSSNLIGIVQINGFTLVVLW